MGKHYGFMEFDRQTHQYDAIDKRIQHFKEFLLPLSKEIVQTQGARCMDCGTPFCHPNCPLHNIIPEFNDLVYRDRWDEALEVLFSTNNFPEFTGRVCPAPCESACVLGIIKPPVTIKNIEYSIIEEAWKAGIVKPRIPAVRTGKKVAVIGSGPTGMAATDQLNQAGHEVTLFERANRIGGLLRYGIPDFKLDKGVIDRRVKLMEEEGVTFKPSTEIGKDVSTEKLMAEFDAVVITAGSTIPRDLPIPGRELNGVHFAMEFLGQNNKRVAGDTIPKEEEIHAKGKKVLVIGGGDTGSDCVGTSIRQGATEVLQIELLPKPPEERTEDTPWPTHPGPRMLSTSTSQQEGCEREWSIMSKNFIDDGHGNVEGVNYVRLDWSNGKPEEIEGTAGRYDADLVLLAMGFLNPDPAGPIKELGLELDDRNNIKADDHQTSVEKVFAAGDCRTGQSLVVSCISDGRECARAVDKFLSGGKTKLPSKNKDIYQAV